MAERHGISRERLWMPVRLPGDPKNPKFALLCAGERRIENRLKRLTAQGYTEAKAAMIVEGEVLDAKQEQRKGQPV